MYLVLDHLSKSFPAPTRGTGKEVTAVDDVSLRIDQGEFVTLLGPSGCGKTTTLRLIAGFEVPTQGHISLDGRSLDSVPPNRRDMAMVFQSYALFPHLTVFENIAYGLRLKKLSSVDMRRKIAEALRLTELSGLEQRAPNQLSGGQQQRVALARALVMEPKVLLFDEPLSNLDAKLREQMRAEIRRIQQTLGITSVYVTHDQAEAMAVSDRIIVMDRATIAQEGAPRELYESPQGAFVAGFMGDANRVRGVLAHRSPTMGELWLGTLAVRIAHRGLPEGEVDVAIRPEAIELGASDGGGLPATVRKAAYLGGTIEYTLDTPIGELFAVSQSVEAPFARGDDVVVTLASHGVVVVPPEP
jgi:iron(III) transport system ATP-binding protein